MRIGHCVEEGGCWDGKSKSDPKGIGTGHGVVVNLRCAANEPKQCENRNRDTLLQSNNRIELPIIQYYNESTSRPPEHRV